MYMIKPFLKRVLGLLAIATTSSFGLTGGPAMPEYTQFAQFDVTSLVDLNTGDFKYTIPILEVPGRGGSYPLALSYHSGIKHHQEASWTGLGWNVNAGSINRSIVETPDDFYKATVYSDVQKDLGESITTGVGASVSLIKKNKDFGPSISCMVLYNTNLGFGGSVSGGIVASSGFGASLSATVFPGGGTSYGASFGYSKAEGYGRMSSSIGLSYTPDAKDKFNASASYSIGLSNKHAKYGGIFENSPTKTFGAGANYSLKSGYGFSNTVMSKSNSTNHEDHVLTTVSTTAFSIPIWGSVVSIDFNQSRYRSFYEMAMREELYGYLYQSTKKGNSVRDAVDLGMNMERNRGEGDYLFNSPDLYLCFANGLTGAMSPKVKTHSSYVDSLERQGRCKVDGSLINGDVLLKYLPEEDISWTDREKVEASSDILFQFYNDPGRSLYSDLHSKGSQFERSRIVNPIIDDNSGAITGFEIIKTDGMIFEFKKPLYNHCKISYSTENYNAEIINSEQAVADHRKRVELEKYAYSWLLTSIRSADYVDNGNNGFDKSDFGFWTKFEYTEPYQYIWRSPYENAQFSPTSGQYDVSLGIKDIAYLKSIETISHKAEFSLSDRRDARGVSKDELVTQLERSQISLKHFFHPSSSHERIGWDLDNDSDEFFAEEIIDTDGKKSWNEVKLNSRCIKGLGDIIDKYAYIEGVYELGKPITSENYSVEKRKIFKGSSEIWDSWGDDDETNGVVQYDIDIGLHGKLQNLIDNGFLKFSQKVLVLKNNPRLAAGNDKGWYVLTNLIDNVQKHSGYRYNLKVQYPLFKWKNPPITFTMNGISNFRHIGVNFVLDRSYIDQFDIRTTLKKLDTITLYKKLDSGKEKPLLRKNLKYDYTLALNTPNSFDTTIGEWVYTAATENDTAFWSFVQKPIKAGKLTLKSLQTETLINEDTVSQPPYVFNYNAKDGNKQFDNSHYYDVWGAFNSTGSSRAPGVEGIGNHITPQNFGPKFGATWNLSDVWTPAGTHVNVIYERDHYYGFTNDRPTIFETELKADMYDSVKFDDKLPASAHIGSHYLPKFKIVREDTILFKCVNSDGTVQKVIKYPLNLKEYIETRYISGANKFEHYDNDNNIDDGVEYEVFSHKFHQIQSIKDSKLDYDIDFANERGDIDTLVKEFLLEKIENCLSELTDSYGTRRARIDLPFLDTMVSTIEDDDLDLNKDDDYSGQTHYHVSLLDSSASDNNYSLVYYILFNDKFNFIGGDVRVKQIITNNMLGQTYTTRYRYNEYRDGRLTNKSSGRTFLYPDVFEKGDSLAFGNFIEYPTRFVGDFYAPSPGIRYNTVTVDVVENADYELIDADENYAPKNQGATIYHFVSDDDSVTINGEKRPLLFVKEIEDGGKKDLEVHNYTSLIGLPTSVNVVDGIQNAFIQVDSTIYSVSENGIPVVDWTGDTLKNKELGLTVQMNEYSVERKKDDGSGDNEVVSGTVSIYDNATYISKTSSRVDNIKNEVENIAFDPILGLPVTVDNLNSSHPPLRTTSIPAYTEYPEMIAQNILSYPYQSISYMDKNNDGVFSSSECISSEISTWTNSMNNGVQRWSIDNQWTWDPNSQDTSFDGGSSSNWINTVEYTELSNFGEPLESLDKVDSIYTSEIENSRGQTIAVALNSPRKEIYYTSLEETEILHNNRAWENSSYELMNISDSAYSGERYALCENGKGQYGPTINIPFSELDLMKAYTFSAAVHSMGNKPAILCIEVHSEGVDSVNYSITKKINKADNWETVITSTDVLTTYSPKPGAYLRIWCGAPDQDASAKVDELRFYPYDALVSTFAYETISGKVKTMVSDLGTRSSLVYDNFGRLKAIYNGDDQKLSETEYHLLRDSISLIDIVGPQNYTEIYPVYNNSDDGITFEWKGPKFTQGYTYKLYYSLRDNPVRAHISPIKLDASNCDVEFDLMRFKLTNLEEEKFKGKILRWYLIATNTVSGVETKSYEQELMLMPPDFFKIKDLKGKQIETFNWLLYEKIAESLTDEQREFFDKTYELVDGERQFKYRKWPYFQDKMSKRDAFSYYTDHRKKSSVTVNEGSAGGWTGSKRGIEKIRFNYHSTENVPNLFASVWFRNGRTRKTGSWGKTLEHKRRNADDYSLEISGIENAHIWYQGFFRDSPWIWTEWVEDGKICTSRTGHRQIKGLRVRAFIYEKQ